MNRALSEFAVAVALAGLAACSDGASVVSPGHPPALPNIRATSVDSGGSLRIVAVVSNRTTVHLQVAVPPQCPLAVAIFPDSTGGAGMVRSGTPTCAASASTTDLAPGDSVIISRTLLANELFQYSPGLYAIDVTVVSKMAMVSVWSGDVRLPLRSVVPLPPGDGPLTGTWIQPSVDTWIQLDLSQSGAQVVGYYRRGSASFGGIVSYPLAVSGTAALPQATLQWSDGGPTTMNATLSNNGDSLTGTWSMEGAPPVPFFRFLRSK